MKHLLTLVLIFCLSSTVSYAADFPWSTTFDCTTGSPIGCDGMTAGLSGDTTNQTEILSAANNTNGAGSNGFRFFQEGHNGISQTVYVIMDTDVADIWVRFYMRYEPGAWYTPWTDNSIDDDGFSDDKLFEIRAKDGSVGNDRVVIHWEPEGFGIWNNGGDGLNYNGSTWNATMTGDFNGEWRETDSTWRSYEVYCSKGTQGQNDGILRAWIDGVLVVESLTVEYGYDEPGWARLVFGENGKFLGSTYEWYVDYDDIVAQATTPSNVDASGNPMIGPIVASSNETTMATTGAPTTMATTGPLTIFN